jgi:dihydrofolate reductase
MSMSLDGYIAGPDDEPGNPGGDGFGRLHGWYGDSSGPSGPSTANYPLVTYVTEGIASATAQAKAAAGDRDVLVHGGYTAQRALEAGVLDELQIHQIPVLFAGGRRLFEVLRRASSWRSSG